MHVPSASFRTHQVPPEQLPPETQVYAPARSAIAAGRRFALPARAGES